MSECEAGPSPSFDGRCQPGCSAQLGLEKVQGGQQLASAPAVHPPKNAPDNNTTGSACHQACFPLQHTTPPARLRTFPFPTRTQSPTAPTADIGLSCRLITRAALACQSLQQFLNKTAALSLYRSFIRATRGLGDLRARQETVAWVRDDFEKYRHEVESVSGQGQACSGYQGMR